MIKVFTLNKNQKIELTQEELKQLLDEAYNEGYYRANVYYYTYTSPSISPYVWTYNSHDTSTSSTLTMNSLHQNNE